MKNIYNIKAYHIHEALNLLKSLDKFPEQDVKLSQLDKKLSQAMFATKLVTIYYIERLCYGARIGDFFLEGENEISTKYKVNLVQLRYASQMLAKGRKVKEEVLKHLYSLDTEAQEFVVSYYNQVNLLGVRIPSLKEWFESKRYGQEIVELPLTHLTEEKVYPKKKVKKVAKPKFPCLVLDCFEPNIKMFIKSEGEVFTDIEDVEYVRALRGALQGYKNISIVGQFERVLKPFLITTKRKIAGKLFKGKAFTLQNNIGYLVQDLARVNNSIQMAGSYSELKPLSLMKGKIVYTTDDFLDRIENGGYILAFRNKFIGTQVKKSRVVVESVEDFGQEFIVGDILEKVVFEDYEYIRKWK